MAENANHDQPEAANEPTVRIAVQTARGTEEVAIADLPDEVRAMLIENIRSGDMPDDVRTTLCKALDIDPNALPEPAETADGSDEAEDNPADPDKARQYGHASGCDCAERHREHVWHILDAAFPQEPHLWKAMEALFELSAVNPHEINDEARRTALGEAALHIKRHTELTAPPLSPLEQMVEQFRKDLGIV